MNAIVVTDRAWAIGRDGDLLFSLPTDMRRFRSMTLDGTVILGRKTLDSFPGGKPLPRRRNIVITHNADFDREGAVIVSSLQEALDAAADEDPDKLWVIGGGSVYTALLSGAPGSISPGWTPWPKEPTPSFPIWTSSRDGKWSASAIRWRKTA